MDKHGALAVKKAWVPGAGTYKPYDTFSSMNTGNPKFSIQGRYPSQKMLNVPGPGTYTDIRPKTASKAAPAYGFGSSPQRVPHKKAVAPGPGAYRVPSTVGALPSYTGVSTGKF